MTFYTHLVLTQFSYFFLKNGNAFISCKFCISPPTPHLHHAVLPVKEGTRQPILLYSNNISKIPARFSLWKQCIFQMYCCIKKSHNINNWPVLTPNVQYTLHILQQRMVFSKCVQISCNDLFIVKYTWREPLDVQYSPPPLQCFCHCVVGVVDFHILRSGLLRRLHLNIYKIYKTKIYILSCFSPNLRF